MDAHMEELFEKAQPFEGGDLTFHPEYGRLSNIALNLENMLDECFGGEVARLMREYAAALSGMERFQCLHYFHQGYLAAQAEKKP